MLARQPLDFCPTPGLLTWALLESHRFVPWRNQATVLEPCNGEGAISDVLKESGLFRFVDTESASTALEDVASGPKGATCAEKLPRPPAFAPVQPRVPPVTASSTPGVQR